MTHLHGSAARLLAVIAPGTPVGDIYGDRGSEVYDAMTRGDDSEVREILRAGRRTTGRILELACGSGRFTFPLARLGREVVALDNSPRMLELLSVRAERTGVRTIRSRVGDMSDFELGGRFGLIVLGTTSISLLARDARRTLLGAVRRHLAPDGTFLVSVRTDESDTGEGAARVIPLHGDETDVVLLGEQRDVSAGHREVSILRLHRRADLLDVEVFASRVHLLDARQLCEELREAGLTVRDTTPVRVAAEGPAISMIECGL